ncbi:MAG: hypothetical protein ACT4PK_06865 [Gammaproteobacteria bacterium]
MTGRGLRIAVLLAILAIVGIDTWLTRSRTTSWEKTLRVSIHPIAHDGRPATQAYVSALARDDFAAVEAFLRREAPRYGVTIAEPLSVWLRPALERAPPLPPADRGLFGTVAWSLKLRWFANRREAALPRPRGQARIFVLYYDPETSPAVAHSLGLKEGLIGIVHAFASRQMTPTNNVVIAHEVLHTLGATDKYDLASGRPRHPDGYAEPDREPLHPQVAAELMGGRIPLAPGRAAIPQSLDDVVVGPATAAEIGWVRE